MYQLELEHVSIKDEYSSQFDMYNQLQNKHTESIQKVNSLEQVVSLLQADESQLQSQMVSKVYDIALLEAEISRLTLEKVLLGLSVDRIKQGKFLLHAENFNGQDGDISFYTDFCSWDLFMLFSSH